MNQLNVQFQPTSTETVVTTLLLTDLVDSTKLVEQLGDAKAAEIFAIHDRVARDLLKQYNGKEIDKTDGFLFLFVRPIDAVLYSIAYHHALEGLSEQVNTKLTARAGIHLGEVILYRNSPDDVSRGAKLIEVEGIAKPLAARIMSLAQGGQTLITRSAFDLARRGVVGSDSAPACAEWMAHGSYMLKGVEEPIEIFEAGVKGVAPLSAPPDTEKAKRSVPVGEEKTLGWRPAVGLGIPHRTSWMLQRKIGEGGFGEVWLAKQAKTGARRVFKFCFDAKRLRQLKRELILFRLMREALGERPDIAQIHDIQLKNPPFYFESEFTDQGNLQEWAESKGGIDHVPISTRLDLMSKVCEALAAAHSIGILHKDLRPSIILIYYSETNEPRPRLSDFGIGVLTDRSQLERCNISMTGMTQTSTNSEESAQIGEKIYAPPESLANRPFTIQGDIYALGVLLYQMIVGDLTQPLAQGWEADILDPLLRDDIACCVAGRPEQRLASAKELALRLRTLHSRRRAKRQRTLLRILAAACVILLIVLIPAMIVGDLFDNDSGIGQPSADEFLHELQRAHLVNEFLTDNLLAAVERSAQMNDTQNVSLRDMLNDASQRIDEASKSGGIYYEQPLVEASIRATLGIAYWKLGMELMAKHHLDKARSLWRNELGANNDPALSLELQEALSEYNTIMKSDVP